MKKFIFLGEDAELVLDLTLKEADLIFWIKPITLMRGAGQLLKSLILIEMNIHYSNINLPILEYGKMYQT